MHIHVHVVNACGTARNVHVCAVEELSKPMDGMCTGEKNEKLFTSLCQLMEEVAQRIAELTDISQMSGDGDTDTNSAANADAVVGAVSLVPFPSVFSLAITCVLFPLSPSSCVLSCHFVCAVSLFPFLLCSLLPLRVCCLRPELFPSP